MEPVTLWVITAIWVTHNGISGEMSERYYTLKSECEAALTQIADFANQQQVLEAYGLSCSPIKVGMKPSLDAKGQKIPQGKGKPKTI